MATNALASLVVSLEANIAKFTTDMKSAADVTQNTMQTIASSVDTAKFALKGIGGALIAKEILDWSDGVIAAAASLQKLSLATGSSVENLSKLANQAKVSGVDFGTLENLAFKLAAAMGGIDDKSLKVQEALKAIGVTSKDPAEALIQVAKSFDQYADGANKAALSRAIFMRSGPEFLAMLHDLAEANSVGATVTAKQAEEAKKLEEAFRRLSVESTTFKNALLSYVVPAILETISAFNMARTAGLGFFAALLAPTDAEGAQAKLTLWEKELLKAQNQLHVAEQSQRNDRDLMVQGAKAEVAAVESKVAAYKQLVNLYQIPTVSGANFRGPLQEAPSPPKLAGKGKEFDVTAAFIARLNEEAAAQKEANNAQLTEARQFQQEMIAIDNIAFQAREVSQVDFLEMKRANDQQYAISAEAIAQQEVTNAQKRLGVLVEIADTETFTARQREELQKSLAAQGLKLTEAENNLAKVRKASNIEDLKDSGDILHAREAIVDAVRKQAQAFDDFLTKLQEEDTERQFQLDLLGRTADEVSVLTEAHRAELEIRRKQLELEKLLNEEWAKGAQARPEVINALYLQLARLPEIYDKTRTSVVAAKQATIDYQNSFEGGWKKAYDSYIQSISAANIAQQAFNTLTQGLETLIVGALSHAKNAWKNFTDSILKMLEQIAAKIAVSGLLQLLGLGSGGFNFSLGGGAGGAGAAGGGLNLNSLLSLGSTASKLTGGAEALGGIGTAFSAGYAGASIPAATLGAGAAAEVGSAAAGAVTAGGIEAGLAAGLAAVPVYGWIALAALIVGGIILGAKKGGGPQTREFGTSGADISTFGDLSATHKLLGTDAVKSAAYSNAALTAQATYDGVTRALGGAAGTAQFAIYTSQDLKGTASNQLDVRSTVGGQAAYTANIVDTLGRDPEKLKAAIQVETQRAILGALQATNFPRYLADIFKSVDAATATEAQIANITATATAIKQVVDTIPELAGVFKQLDATSTLALVDLAGGVEKFNQQMGYLAANFETSAERSAKANLTLTQGFTDLGLAVPKTHADFLALLASFDLTTESGRKLYTSVLALSGAFIEVKGTADQAAAALQQSLSGLHEAQLGYAKVGANPVETAQLQLAHDTQTTNSLIQQFIADKPWAQAFVAGGGNLGDLLANIQDSDFAHYDATNQQTITAIISGTATIHQDNINVAQSLDDYAAAQRSASEQQLNTNISDALSIGQQRVSLFGTLAGQSTGDFGQKLALQLQYINTEITSLQNELKHVTPSTNYGQALAAEIKSLQAAEKPILQELQFFTSLSSRYGASIAEQLVKLTETYGTQADQLRGNAGALALLNASFEDQWNAIINGTEKGVSGVQDQLKKLQQNILDYVDSLKISQISPLTPTQKLAEARAQYEADLAKAGTGDQKALGDVTGSADAFLKLARDFYASSTDYTNIFNMVTGQLTALGTADLGAVAVPMNAADQALLDALPVGSKLMSAADMAAVGQWLGTGTQTGLVAVPIQTPIAKTAVTSPYTAANPFVTPGTETAPTTDTVSPVVDAVYTADASSALRSQDVVDAINQWGAATVEAITVGLK